MLADALNTAAKLRAFADAMRQRADQRIVSAFNDEIDAVGGVTWVRQEAADEGVVRRYGAMTIDGEAVDVDVQAWTDAPARWSVRLTGRRGTIHGSGDTAAGAMAKARAAWVKR